MVLDSYSYFVFCCCSLCYFFAFTPSGYTSIFSL
jgi:hypothetical protein